MKETTATCKTIFFKRNKYFTKAQMHHYLIFHFPLLTFFLQNSLLILTFSFLVFSFCSYPFLSSRNYVQLMMVIFVSLMVQLLTYVILIQLMIFDLLASHHMHFSLTYLISAH